MTKVHEVVHDLSSWVSKRLHRPIFLTPRSFLDFIQHFGKLLEEKTGQLQREQTHIRTGITKLVETEKEVAQMQADLKVKQKDLETQNVLAEEKLGQIMRDQGIADRSKSEASALKKEVAVRKISVAEEREKANAELATVEPLVKKARQAVEGIQKKNLDEIRAFASPPTKVRTREKLEI
eukprot:c46021_g1_i1.p2 GENE.c46021_g1_i1~~c46021_g1_i1.p2  ORF type:complete len:180 (-),score=40.28 c46021_g1_i1:1242-1781(-)